MPHLEFTIARNVREYTTYTATLTDEQADLLTADDPDWDDPERIVKLLAAYNNATTTNRNATTTYGDPDDHDDPEVSLLSEGLTDPTWTFFGHWENDQLAIEYAIPGTHTDPREDTGYWEEGLWCATGTGPTRDEAQRNATSSFLLDDDPGPQDT